MAALLDSDPRLHFHIPETRKTFTNGVQQSSATMARGLEPLAYKERLRESARRRQKGKSNFKSPTPKWEVIKKMETNSSPGRSVKGQGAQAAAREILMGHKEEILPREDD